MAVVDNRKDAARACDTRVLVVDDHPLVREGLRELLDMQPGLRVVGVEGDGHKAVDAAATLLPDVVVMDVWLPHLSGLLALAAIRKANPKVRVVMLSAIDKGSLVVEALRAGASGFVLKSAATSELVEAIHAARAGQKFLSRSVADRLVEQVIDPDPESSQPLRTLTQREREILQRLAEGLTARSIANELHISPRTVETHRASVMRKLGVHKAAELVRIAIREGLVAP